MLTPLDIHNREFKKALRGYDEAEVDQFLDEIVRDYETIFRELSVLRDKVLSHEERLDNYQQMEESLKRALLVAQDTAETLKSNAHHESELIVREAELRASRLIDEAMSRTHHIVAEHDDMRRSNAVFRSRMKALLQAQLEMLDSEEWRIPDTTEAQEESE